MESIKVVRTLRGLPEATWILRGDDTAILAQIRRSLSDPSRNDDFSAWENVSDRLKAADDAFWLIRQQRALHHNRYIAVGHCNRYLRMS